jgi:hypothetical protein
MICLQSWNKKPSILGQQLTEQYGIKEAIRIHEYINSVEFVDKFGSYKDTLATSMPVDMIGKEPTFDWVKENVLNEKNSDNQVNFQLKAVTNLSSNLPKVNSWFKQMGNADKFWTKVQQDLQIPKEQVRLLKESKGDTIEEKLLDFTANYSQVIEVNTATTKEGMYYDKFKGYDVVSASSFEEVEELKKEGYEQDGITEDGEPRFKRKKDNYDEIVNSESERNTSHYSDLTVPGGTNYTENEISTPDITSSIKGHAQFSTDNGLGWFRSDDKINGKTDDSGAYFEPEEIGLSNIKTRRILEVQSDLFQKGRDKDNLVSGKELTEKSINIEDGLSLIHI